jgi:hypothetical protein
MARDNLPAVGHELDELIAVKVFYHPKPLKDDHPPDHIDIVWYGALSVWFCLPSYDDGDNCLWEALHFSADMRWAWKVVERMEELGFFPLIEKSSHASGKDIWCALFKKYPRDINGVLACASTPAHAICLAALDALKVK